jgi:hypothetical protein
VFLRKYSAGPAPIRFTSSWEYSWKVWVPTGKCSILI